ncbi:carboxymuconolactone decarboxylase family protein [Sphingobium sp. EP60837]|uniref:carboxymuconolactone decarboxylase family protein n=1 Tax=Sphingobium sp. EP60837 TaxID=1855519 RepID=UPI0007DD137D|nr:carboxymuconolactone decarboxylase family protein [Sphingobium sp. EP60837]ANI80129.1 hypothetical protein EP837_03747 [Sphingobium sp. EP60837]
MTTPDFNLASLDALFSRPEVAEAMKRVSRSGYASAAKFWQTPLQGPHLSARMKELVFFTMHVAATSLNGDAIKRQVKRIIAAGGTQADIFDVVVTIASLANHALYSSVPVLEEELAAIGEAGAPAEEFTPELEAAKQQFLEVRGFWNEHRDPVARMMPEYTAALIGIATETWQNGPLTRKERELVCIAVDCNVTHSFPSGLRTHIRNALDAGATKGEIMEVFQMAALLGLEGFILTGEAMFGE